MPNHLVALMDLLDSNGRYLGVDVTRDSIEWCKRNITKNDERFQFHHFDAKNELYNPLGKGYTTDFRLPVKDESVDRIGLASVFTHLLEDEKGLEILRKSSLELYDLRFNSFSQRGMSASGDICSGTFRNNYEKSICSFDI